MNGGGPQLARRQGGDMQRQAIGLLRAMHDATHSFPVALVIEETRDM